MKTWKDILLDDESMWPTDKIVPLPEVHEDARGSIKCLVNFPMKNVSLITSKKGTLRSNHYHLTDWHYMYVLSGSMDYYYRPVGSEEPPDMVTVKPGVLVFTPPMEEHATVFNEHCSFLALSRNPRDQEAYEADVKRVELLDPKDYIGG